MIWVVTLLRSKVCCSTTTEATSHCLPGPPLRTVRSRAALQPGTCGNQRCRAAPDCQVVWHPGGKNSTAAGTCRGGWRVDVPMMSGTQLAKRVLKSPTAGRWRDFVEREAKPTRDSRAATTGPAPVEQPACDSILTIMELTVNPGPTNIALANLANIVFFRMIPLIKGHIYDFLEYF